MGQSVVMFSRFDVNHKCDRRRRRRRFWHLTLRLRSAIRRHHTPQRAALSQVCCVGERNRGVSRNMD